jgi:tetratricopeptide (TPR) repeat protein
MYFVLTIETWAISHCARDQKDFTENIIVAKAPPPIPESKKTQMDSISQAFLELGIAHADEMEYEEAVKYLKKVLTKYPESGKANWQIGFCYYSLGKKNLAIESFKIALNDQDLNPNERSIVCSNLFVVYNEQKDFIQAEVYAKKALKLNRGHAEYNSLAYLYAQQGINLKEALEMINKAILILEDAWDETRLFFYLDTRGWIYYKMGKLHLAERDILGALEIMDKYSKSNAEKVYGKEHIAEVYYHLGIIHNAQGKKDLAKQNFIKSLAWDNSYINAKNALQNF